MANIQQFIWQGIQRTVDKTSSREANIIHTATVYAAKFLRFRARQWQNVVARCLRKARKWKLKFLKQKAINEQLRHEIADCRREIAELRDFLEHPWDIV